MRCPLPNKERSKAWTDWHRLKGDSEQPVSAVRLAGHPFPAGSESSKMAAMRIVSQAARLLLEWEAVMHKDVLKKK
ncbi:hypothetical protein [Pontiella sulfatireligans]|uniref:Uncharacterized protein n=1 Tax=Pontiella sulfatireligans TaxID=2750658 RepID=A0A6C2UHX9_9BACT|nr:hypothetical protein [Pontiella sulfatireligans]VGO19800.1 hypothetical protein SCARR_01860 [Pontiella sulfatireligans]